MSKRDFIALTLEVAREHAGPREALTYFDSELDGIAPFDVWGVPSDFLARMTRQSLLSYAFGSDEVANAAIYAIDGRDFVLVQKFGDRSAWDHTILDREAYKDFLISVAEVALQKRLRETEDGGDAIIGNGNSYIALSRGQAGVAIHIQSPRWHVSFTRLFETHLATYQEATVAFVGWANPKAQSWEEGAHDIVIRLPDGSDRKVHGSDIAFLVKTHFSDQANDL